MRFLLSKQTSGPSNNRQLKIIPVKAETAKRMVIVIIEYRRKFQNISSVYK